MSKGFEYLNDRSTRLKFRSEIVRLSFLITLGYKVRLARRLGWLPCVGSAGGVLRKRPVNKERIWAGDMTAAFLLARMPNISKTKGPQQFFPLSIAGMRNGKVWDVQPPEWAGNRETGPKYRSDDTSHNRVAITAYLTYIYNNS